MLIDWDRMNWLIVVCKVGSVSEVDSSDEERIEAVDDGVLKWEEADIIYLASGRVSESLFQYKERNG